MTGFSLIVLATLLGISSASVLKIHEPHHEAEGWKDVDEYEVIAAKLGLWDKIKEVKGKKWAHVTGLVHKKKEAVVNLLKKKHDLIKHKIHKEVVVLPAWKIHKYKGFEIKPVKYVHDVPVTTYKPHVVHHKPAVVHHVHQKPLHHPVHEHSHEISHHVSHSEWKHPDWTPIYVPDAIHSTKNSETETHGLDIAENQGEGEIPETLAYPIHQTIVTTIEDHHIKSHPAGHLHNSYGTPVSTDDGYVIKEEKPEIYESYPPYAEDSFLNSYHLDGNVGASDNIERRVQPPVHKEASNEQLSSLSLEGKSQGGEASSGEISIHEKHLDESSRAGPASSEGQSSP